MFLRGEENIAGSQSNLFLIARICVYFCFNTLLWFFGFFLFFSQQGQGSSHGTVCAMLHNDDSPPRDSIGLEMMKRVCQVNKHCACIIMWLRVSKQIPGKKKKNDRCMLIY